MCRWLDRRESWSPAAAAQRYRRTWRFVRVTPPPSGRVHCVPSEEAHRTALQAQSTGVDDASFC